MNTEFTVGITNQGEPGIDFSWVEHLDAVEFAVVVSKAANEKFEDVLLENKNKIIYHAVCTGLNGTEIEPNVPTVTEKFQHLQRLINLGFPTKQIVLRVDPLFPFQWMTIINRTLRIDYIQKLYNILMMAENLKIKRVRYSYLNLYDFVLSKLQQISHDFVIDPRWKPIYNNEIQLDKLNRNFEYEACAEFFVPPHHQIPCISYKDLEILKKQFTHELSFKKLSNKNDPACHCPSNKLELLVSNNFKCDYDCKYCYWKSARIDHSKPVF